MARSGQQGMVCEGAGRGKSSIEKAYVWQLPEPTSCQALPLPYL